MNGNNIRYATSDGIAICEYCGESIRQFRGQRVRRWCDTDCKAKSRLTKKGEVCDFCKKPLSVNDSIHPYRRGGWHEECWQTDNDKSKVRVAFKERLRTSEDVYIMRLGEDGPVKIGIAKDVEKRKQALQTGHHKPLIVLRIYPRMGRQFERAMHRAYASWRITGEWFQWNDMLAQAVGHTPIGQAR